MKLTALLVFISAFWSLAFGGYAQSAKLTVVMENATVKNILGVIEDQSEFRFFYSGDVDVERKASVNLKDRKIFDILDEIFEDTNVKYEVYGRQIALIDKSETFFDKTLTQQQDAMQQKTVSGKITDSSGQPLPGVTVIVKGTTQGTVTNVDGSYSIVNVAPGGTLQFSFVGMKTQEIPINGKTSIDVVMYETAIGLDEVVAIGYGTVKKKDVTGSTVNVGGDELVNKPATSVTEALQGMVAGVTITNNGGSPAEGPTIRIRGLSTLNAEGPLWIVDGIVNDNGVDPNEIESITVLKDASAAIYGTRASGGVILVTTKSGKKGLKVTADVKYGWSNINNKLEALDADQYCNFYTDVYNAAGQPVPTIFSDSYFRTTRTNWLDAITQTGITQDYSFTVSGGTDKSTFSIFTNWKDQTGTLHNTFNKSGRIRIKSNHKVNDRITIGQNLSVTTGNSRGANTTSGYTGAILGAIYYPPSAKIWSDQANGIYSGVVDPNEVDVSLAGQFGDLLNQYAALDRENEYKPNINALLNAYIEVDLIDGLKFKSNISYKQNQYYLKSFDYSITEPGKVYDFNQLNTEAQVEKSLVAEQLLTYQKEIGRHNISALAGYTAEEYEQQYFGTSARGFASEEEWAQHYVNATDFDTQKPYSSFGDYSLVSLIGRVSYNYDNKYYLTGVLRRDGTSKVTADNRWGTFPSISAAWRVTGEDFMKDNGLFDDLKIRTSWGKMGNINPLTNYAFAVSLEGKDVWIGETPQKNKAYYMNGISNEDLKWETTASLDFGIDALLLDSRFNIVADYYLKTVKDMLAQPELSNFAGVSQAPWINVGEVENKGFEFLLGWNDKVGNIKYRISANASHNTNELIKYTDTKDFEVDGTHMRYTLYPFRSEVGQPLYSYYLVKTDGIFQSDVEAKAYQKNGNMIQPNAKAGDIKFVDYNNDGVINSDDKQFCGDYYPDFTYGINLSVEYKNWDFTAMLQGVQGVDIFAGYKLTTYMPTQGYNVLTNALDAWSPTNTGTDIPRLTMLDENHNYSTESDWYLEDGSYLRLKNLVVGYTIPASITNKFGVSKIRLFATGQNLITITGYSGFDPEVGNYGMDNMKYPQARTIMVGANINF